ncbi:hypothetical protein [Fervidobacterium thailandense]|uniref:Uncharacterized protein n=1 Tax=Fervidobacterium thailandense TaxID=1008305 RepID=A0A1E3G168_9BACT|nr:hypothetical protein [Fervidobacterium thailandense]ODN29994.1 hypothetical protein A4H02_07920 [Fervidobacterium thailandense]
MAFVNVLRMNVQTYIELLRNGVITIEEAVKDLEMLDEDERDIKLRLQYGIVEVLMRGGALDSSILSKVLQLPDDFGTLKLLGSYKFEFPVVITRNKSGKIVEGLAIESSVSFTNIPNAEEGVKIIENILGKKLIVLFSEPFSGNSFMLPLYLSVATCGKIQEMLPHILFTGGFKSLHGLLPTDYVDAKQKTANAEGKELVIIDELGDLRKFSNFITSEEKHVPLFVGSKITQKKAEDEYKKLHTAVLETKNVPTPELLVKLLGEEPYVCWEGDLDVSQFEDIAQEIVEFLRGDRFKIQKVGDFIPHIAMKVPISLAFLVGLKLKPYRKLVLYHFDTDKYFPVLDLSSNPREVASRNVSQGNFKKIEFSLKNLTNDSNTVLSNHEFAIIIDMAGRSIQDAVEKFLLTNDKKMQVVTITHKNSGCVPLSNWSEEVAEIKSVINMFNSSKTVYHLFFSCPVPIGFGLGLALKEDTHKLNVYHFFQGEYRLVYSNIQKQ